MQFERLNQIIAVSVSEDKYSVMSDLVVTNKSLDITFSDYVKSQIHLNISYDLFDVPLSVFVNAAKFMQGITDYRSSAIKVLDRFYTDISNFLIKNPNDVSLQINIDCDFGIERVYYDIGSVEAGIVDIASGKLEDIKSFTYAEIIDFADGAEDLRNKVHSYSVAAVLRNEIQHAKSNEIRQVCIGGVDESKS